MFVAIDPDGVVLQDGSSSTPTGLPERSARAVQLPREGVWDATDSWRMKEIITPARSSVLRSPWSLAAPAHTVHRSLAPDASCP